jgi:hypothetical protein
MRSCARSVSRKRESIGHDIGLIVAYAYATRCDLVFRAFSGPEHLAIPGKVCYPLRRILATFSIVFQLRVVVTAPNCFSMI